MGFVDLHVHSNASDGTFSPSQVVELAKNAGLDAFALTDHDTTAGVPEALEKGRDLNIEVIPGIEVSSSFDGTEIHILGLFVNSDDPVLAAMLEKMRISRDRRNEKMLENLAADGISFTKEEICGDNPDTIITRAHIAHALVAKGICSGMDQAFKKYLQYGGRYCPQKEHLSPEEVVKTLISNGAFVALAHPFQYPHGRPRYEGTGSLPLLQQQVRKHETSGNGCQTSPAPNRRFRLPRREQTGYFDWYRTGRTQSFFPFTGRYQT